MTAPLQVKALSESEITVQVGDAQIQIKVSLNGVQSALLPATLTQREIRGAPLPPRSPDERVIVDRLSLDPEFLKRFDGQSKSCPHCGFHGEVSKFFGQRKLRGHLSVQSWCADCRAKGNYRKKPRKYRVARPEKF